MAKDKRQISNCRRQRERGDECNNSSLPFALCPLPFAIALLRRAICLLATAYCLLSLCFAQAPPAQPYATIDRQGVSYNGPGRDSGHDLAGPVIRLGLLAPLAGPHRSEGQALQRAAEMAIKEANATSLPGGRHLAMVTRDGSGPWGQASSEIVRMVFDDQAVAVITSAEGDDAHLAEQVANKIGVSVLTLSSDTTTTEINLPWIFRLGPDDAMQAQAFARDIYQANHWQRVVLLTQDDHDGRVGGQEFAKAANELHAPSPARMTTEELGKSTADRLPGELRGTQAIVIWSDAATAQGLVARVRELAPAVPLYLCRKASPGDWNTGDKNKGETHVRMAGIWTVEEPHALGTPGQSFARRYRQRFGGEPSVDAAEAYDAVRLLAASLRQSGPNRARLRDALASISGFPGVSGIISFDHAGNDTSQASLLKLK